MSSSSLNHTVFPCTLYCIIFPCIKFPFSILGRFRPRFSDTRCSQVAVSPNRYLLGTSLSYMSPTNVVCRDQGDNIITSSGTVSRRMINDTSYRVGFTFPRNTPFTVTCSISNGPSGTITTVSMTCIGSSSKLWIYIYIVHIFILFSIIRYQFTCTTINW